jgi:hypothetical protein
MTRRALVENRQGFSCCYAFAGDPAPTMPLGLGEAED